MSGTAMISQKTPEVTGPMVIRIRAHVGGAHVEKVVRMLGGVGDAGAEIAALLDNCHHDRSLSVAQQMRGEENAARAAADDKHAPHL